MCWLTPSALILLLPNLTEIYLVIILKSMIFNMTVYDKYQFNLQQVFFLKHRFVAD